jgi:hypothetical protein
MTHGYAANLAHAVLLAIDNPTAAAGQIYNCGDEEQLALRRAARSSVASSTTSVRWEWKEPAMSWSKSQ